MRTRSSSTTLFVYALCVSSAASLAAACSGTQPDAAPTSRDKAHLGASGGDEDSPDGGAGDNGNNGSTRGLAAGSNDADGGDPTTPTNTPPETDPNGPADPTATQPGPDTVDPSTATGGAGVDRDGDGLSDAAETSSLLGVDLAAAGADPNHKDVFVYIDYYEPPTAGALDAVVTAFENARGFDNPDGTTGITLHPILGKQIDGADQKAYANMTQICPDDKNPNQVTDWGPFQKMKDKYFTPTKWQKAAHYMIFANAIGGTLGTSGCSRGIPAHDFVVALGTWANGKDMMVQAGTFMHELGHNLGLQHNGSDSANNTPNYISVMNYNYQTTGIPRDNGQFILDYSRFTLAEVNEAALNEEDGMPLTAVDRDPPREGYDIAHYGAIFNWLNPETGESEVWRPDGTILGWLDFNDNKTREAAIEPTDLDGDGRTDGVFHESWNDWENLAYNGGDEEGGGVVGDVQPIGTGVARYAIDSQLVSPENMPKELTPR